MGGFIAYIIILILILVALGLYLQTLRLNQRNLQNIRDISQLKEDLDKLNKEKENLQKKLEELENLDDKEKLNLLDEISKKKIIEAEKKAEQIIQNAKKEFIKRQNDILNLEKALLEREKLLDQKINHLSQKEKKIEEEYKYIDNQKDSIKDLEKKLQNKLEEIAKLSKEEAKVKLLENIRKELKDQIATEIKNFKEDLEKEKDKIAQEIIVDAMTVSATDFVGEFATTTIKLQSPEIKGKIIGKEGRNIKAFQRITGVDLIIDEEDDYLIISSFDPLRREIAKIALEKLLKDGRINPARIEEIVDKARIEINKQIIKDGEEIAIKAGFNNLSLEKLKYLGRMKYRYSYGQCLATHVLEVVNFVEKAASELKLDVQLAKECALWHDIGKVETHEKEGNHMELGEKIGIKLGLRPEVINAMYAHHMARDPICMESALIYIADANSAARPGARTGTQEDYVKRIKTLEEVAKKHEGVKEAYAIEAGREIRIFVDPIVVDDSSIIIMSNEIAKEIKNKLSYPGVVKVTVIREIRAEAIAN